MQVLPKGSSEINNDEVALEIIMNENKLKNKLFIRNIALITAIFFISFFIILHITLTISINNCQINNNTQCDIDTIQIKNLIIFVIYWAMPLTIVIYGIIWYLEN